MMKLVLYLIQFITLFSVFHQGFSYFLTVDAHAEECFFDKVEVGSKLGMLFKFLLTTCNNVWIKEGGYGCLFKDIFLSLAYKKVFTINNRQKLIK